MMGELDAPFQVQSATYFFLFLNSIPLVNLTLSQPTLCTVRSHLIQTTKLETPLFQGRLLTSYKAQCM